jgi:uncharacterized Zn finger protein (UPF0148 family)
MSEVRQDRQETHSHRPGRTAAADAAAIAGPGIMNNVQVVDGAPLRPRHCPNCGAPCGTGRFCTQCGEKLPLPQQTQPALEQDEKQAPAAARRDPLAEPESGPSLRDEVPQADVEAAPAPSARVPAMAVLPSPSARQPSYAVVCHRTGKPDFTVTLRDGENTVGQAPDCDVVLPGDQYASRSHARLAQADGRLTIEDLGSSNGTFIRLRGAVELQPGDEVLIGTSILKVDAPS